MLKINKITRYAISTLAVLEPGKPLSVPDIALKTFIPVPTIAKVTKILARGGFVTSTRGAGGGYIPVRAADRVSLLEIIEAIEGKIMITECLGGSTNCQMSKGCAARLNWIKANDTIRKSLAGITLADMGAAGVCK